MPERDGASVGDHDGFRLFPTACYSLRSPVPIVSTKRSLCGRPVALLAQVVANTRRLPSGDHRAARPPSNRESPGQCLSIRLHDVDRREPLRELVKAIGVPSARTPASCPLPDHPSAARRRVDGEHQEELRVARREGPWNTSFSRPVTTSGRPGGMAGEPSGVGPVGIDHIDLLVAISPLGTAILRAVRRPGGDHSIRVPSTVLGVLSGRIVSTPSRATPRRPRSLLGRGRCFRTRTARSLPAGLPLRKRRSRSLAAEAMKNGDAKSRRCLSAAVDGFEPVQGRIDCAAHAFSLRPTSRDARRHCPSLKRQPARSGRAIMEERACRRKTVRTAGTGPSRPVSRTARSRSRATRRCPGGPGQVGQLCGEQGHRRRRATDGAGTRRRRRARSTRAAL